MKISNQIKWVAINGFFVVALCSGYIGGIDGAKNVADVLAWFSIIGALMFLSQNVLDKVFEDYEGRSVPKNINILTDVAIAMVFVWYGAIFTGFMYLTHIGLIEYYHKEMIERGYEE